MRIFTFDTTLRDGTQGEGISFSVDDKLDIAQKLDEFGIDYIEGGWPGSNPKDEEFFQRARKLKFGHARLTAFGSTHLARNPAHEDRNLLALAHAGTPAVAIFGKTWDLHVERALGISLDENLNLISESVAFLSSHGKEVIFDAEHFFDGYTANPEYALATLDAAKRAGAHALCLCDTNGGTLTVRLQQTVAEARKRFDGVIGIHTHSDSDVAVANALAAVEAGATMVQGCLNGYGERCGNANLASIIANLELKLGHSTVGRDKLSKLASVCGFIAETANVPLRNDQPYVGKSAFAHKGGIHVSAVLKDSATYDVAPTAIGNRQRVLVSDLSGRANIVFKLKQLGLEDRLSDDARHDLLQRMKRMEHDGYDLETAGGSFALLLLESLFPGVPSFEVESYQVTIAKEESDSLNTTATVSLRAGGLDRVCPDLREPRLLDYKVRLLDAGDGTAGKVRVLVGWSDGRSSWSTAGVSDNVVQASWSALLDAVRLEMVRLRSGIGEVAHEQG